MRSLGISVEAEGEFRQEKRRMSLGILSKQESTAMRKIVVVKEYCLYVNRDN